MVPIDFSINTSVALSRALDICGKNDTIHLFHEQFTYASGVSHLLTGVFMNYGMQVAETRMKISMNRLEQIKAGLLQDDPSLSINCSVDTGQPVQQAIIEHAKKISADLIVLGKHSHHFILPVLNTVKSSAITAETGVPVLTVKAGAIGRKIRTVVLVVNAESPAAKLSMLESFSGKPGFSLRLVGFAESLETGLQQTVFDIFRALRARHCPVSTFDMLSGNNKVKVLAEYCREVGADLVIVEAGKETKAGTWRDVHLSDLLPGDSFVQVLAVSS